MGVACRWVFSAGAVWPPRARLRTPPTARRSIQKTVLRSGDSSRKARWRRISGGAVTQAGGLVHVLHALQFAFEPRQRVERGGVGVAGFFEKIGAIFKGHAASDGHAGKAVAARVRGQRPEEQPGAIVQRGAGAGDAARQRVLRLEHELDIAGELVEALRGEANAEVVAWPPLRARGPHRR